MSVIIPHGANNDAMYPCLVLNAPGQGNLAYREVRLVLNYFVEAHPVVNLTALFEIAYPYVNCASFPDVWARTVDAEPPMLEIKTLGSVLALQPNPTNGDTLANGVQVVFSVPFETQARKYPLLPENLAL